MDIETFAENVGFLTRTVFNLDSSATDFQRVLTRLAQNYSTDEIESMFQIGLSQQGRALLATLKARQAADESD